MLGENSATKINQSHDVFLIPSHRRRAMQGRYAVPFTLPNEVNLPMIWTGTQVPGKSRAQLEICVWGMMDLEGGCYDMG